MATPSARQASMTLRLALASILIAANVPAALAADPPLYQAIEDVVYSRKDEPTLTCDVLTPVQKPKNLGVILVISSNWKSAKPATKEETDWMRCEDHPVGGLIRGGYTVFVVRHGSFPQSSVPEIVPDIRRAIRFIRHHAPDYKIDPARIGITGSSSGGHLSLMAALTADGGNAQSKDPVEQTDSRVRAIVAWFPQTDLINWREPGGWTKIQEPNPGDFDQMFGKSGTLEARLRSISPTYFVSPAAPPLLLLHGDKDEIIPLQQSELMRAKYESLGIPVRLVVREGGEHKSWPGMIDDYPAVWEWFDKHLKQP